MAISSKPDEVPTWASSDVTNPITGANVKEPPALKKSNGFDWLEKPAYEWINWLYRKIYQWINYFNQFFSTTHQFKINEIVEFDTDNGVDIEGTLLKDNDINTTDITSTNIDISNELTVDVINEHTTASGVMIENNLLKDATIYSDIINEKTTDNGVDIDGTNIKDGILTDDGSDGIGVETVDGAILRTKILEIGDWDMNADATKQVTHGISNFKNVRSIIAIIRNDADDDYRPIDHFSTPTGMHGGVGSIVSTYITLVRLAAGNFDSVNYDSTSYNRGWVIVRYID